MKTYLCVYLGSALLALMTTPIAIWTARRINAVDVPGVRAVHTRPIPRIGGVAVFVSSMLMIGSVLLLDNVIGQAFRTVQWELTALLSGATCIFLVGLADDLRSLPARVKFAAEVVATILLCGAGIQITSLHLTDEIVVRFGVLSCPLTLLWVVGVTNAVNLSDGLDGLAAGVSAVACAVIAFFAIYSENALMAVFMLALLGSLTGFLFFNFNPARTFLGDCGSLFLGFTIASSSVMCLTKSAAVVGLALPVLALGIPIFDTFLAMLRRFLERRSLFSPDRSHFHHRLIDLGFKQRHAVITIYVVTLVATGFGLFMMIRQDIGALIVFACTLVLLLLLFRVVGAVQFKEVLTGLQRKHLATQRRNRERRAFEGAQLLFRRARSSVEWWQAVCEAAAQLEFAWVSLRVVNEDGGDQISVWRRARTPAESSRIATLRLPVIDKEGRQTMEFELAILVNGSLESTGHRASLFSRLIEEERCLVAQGPTASLRVAQSAPIEISEWQFHPKGGRLDAQSTGGATTSRRN